MLYTLTNTHAHKYNIVAMRSQCVAVYEKETTMTKKKTKRMKEKRETHKENNNTTLIAAQLVSVPLWRQKARQMSNQSRRVL